MASSSRPAANTAAIRLLTKAQSPGSWAQDGAHGSCLILCWSHGGLEQPACGLRGGSPGPALSRLASVVRGRLPRWCVGGALAIAPFANVGDRAGRTTVTVAVGLARSGRAQRRRLDGAIEMRGPGDYEGPATGGLCTRIGGRSRPPRDQTPEARRTSGPTNPLPDSHRDCDRPQMLAPFPAVNATAEAE
jgi:hypothetical protein